MATWFARYALCFFLVSLAYLAITPLVAKVDGGLRVDGLPHQLFDRFMHFDNFSNRLYSVSVERYARQGDADLGGFMQAVHPELHIAAVKLIDGPGVEREAYPYISNFSLQYSVGKYLSFGSPRFASIGVALFRVLCLAGMALIAGALAAFVHGRAGILGGIAMAASLTLSPIMLARAGNSYWVLCLCFLPLVLALWRYPATGDARRRAGFYALIGLLVFVKSLTGYEYLSSIVMGVMAAALYHEYVAHPRLDLALARIMFARCMAIGLVSVAGFAAAVCLHIWKASAFFGSWSKGVQAFVVPLTYSLEGVASQIAVDRAISPGVLTVKFLDTFLGFNWAVSLPVAGILLVTTVLVARRRGLPVRDLWRSLPPDARALWVALPFGMIASASWFFLAMRHSIVHPHLNWIVAYLGYLPFAVAIAARNLRELVEADGKPAWAMQLIRLDNPQANATASGGAP